MKHINVVVLTHTGNVRKTNEDNFYAFGKILDNSESEYFHYKDKISFEEGCLLGVFDGMGGLHYGAYASYLAAKTVKEIISNFRSKDDENILKILNIICHKSNRLICRTILEETKQRMGSTLSILYFMEDKVFLCNIGDSPIYCFRNSRLKQLSKEHTEKELQQKLCGLSLPDEPDKKYRLTQNLGIFPEEMELEPYMAKGNTCINDIYLICSDGLTDMVDDKIICDILCNENTLNIKGKILLDKALKNGGKDNITIILVEIQ